MKVPCRGWSRRRPPPTLEPGEVHPPCVCGTGTLRGLCGRRETATVKTQRALSDEQERLRIEGLRALTRIIARRAIESSPLLANPTPDFRGEGTQRERVRRNRSA